MDTKVLLEEINKLLEHDAEYQQIKAQIEKHEPAYLRILAQLSQEDRESLELYIAFCEDAQYHRIYPAYHIGRHQQIE